MEYKALIYDEKWSTLINLWHFLSDDHPNLPIGQPQMSNLWVKRPPSMEEIKEKIRNIYFIQKERD